MHQQCLCIFRRSKPCLKHVHVVLKRIFFFRARVCSLLDQSVFLLFQEDERDVLAARRAIVVIKRNEVPGSLLGKTLKAVMKLRTYLEWKDPPAGKEVKGGILLKALILNFLCFLLARLEHYFLKYSFSGRPPPETLSGLQNPGTGVLRGQAEAVLGLPGASAGLGGRGGR